MLYYGKKTPNVDDIVFVYIHEFSTGGTYCKLIEYDEIEGFILNTELDKKVYKPQKNFTLGETYPMLVLAVNEKGIDLSYKKVSATDRPVLLEKFASIQKTCHLVKEYAYLTKMSLDDVSKLTVWKLFEKDHLSDPKSIYNSIIKDPHIFTRWIEVEHAEKTKLFIENVNSRITMTDMTVQQNFDLMICDEDAVSKLKQVLNYDEDKDTQIRYISSPRYQVLATGSSQTECDDKIEKCLNYMKSRMKSYNCIFNLHDKSIAKQQDVTLKPLHMQ